MNNESIGQGKAEDNGKIQWHPAFRGAMKLVWREHKQDLEFQGEVHLGELPNIVDMIVILKRPDVKLNDPIGAGFRGHNLIEFKSPNDALNIDVVAKAICYAHDYKSQGSSVNSRKLSDITMTLMRATLPNNILKSLEDAGACISKPSPGIYEVNGMSLVSTRIVAYDELPESDEYLYLKSLTENMSHDFGKKIVAANRDMLDDEDRRNVNSVMYVTLDKHRDIFKRLITEDKMVVYDSYKILFEDEFKQVRSESLAEGMAKGKAHGIIELGRDLGFSDDKIIGHISSKCNCTPAVAAQLFHQYESNMKHA